ncbi:heparin-binding EGF-like growth factor a [Denticeps clupeoides]|uniref:Proheparin-binding EGF-like growth factor n=1 Tax=Denticeps clupeoides TaxID=299321 RepID=A0AAY4CFZ1_9TELE|nr:proheparin-binding EGF-like growth factor [Denticeps clupeoides]
MKFVRLAVLFMHALVISMLANGASLDRYESKKPLQTSVVNLMGPGSEMEPAGQRDYVKLADDGEHDEDYYEDYEDDYGMSGDFVPQVAFSSKPKDSTMPFNTEKTEGGQRRGKGKGKGKKRNPCLKKYKDFCIHGTCQYLTKLRKAYCKCHEGYSGERCHDITLSMPVGKGKGNYDRTTALAVVAIVLSSLCLVIIGLLLALRFHKRGAYDVENEEKIKLGAAPHH